MTSTLFPAPTATVADGSDPRLAGITIKRRIGTYGAHLVLVDSHGRVFIRPADEPRAAVMASRYPEMVVGTFNDAATSLDIAEAIVFVYGELAGVAA
jgi:hypothetical protein